MSQISITGASTGTATFTIESPATSTNRTLTLPDETGTIITTAGVPASSLPAGSVLQVVSAAKTDRQSFSLTDNNYQDITGLSVSITPSSASNKIFVQFSIGAYGTNNISDLLFRIDRSGTAIAIGDSGVTYRSALAVRTNANELNSAGHFSYLDSPASTSSLTYKIQIAATGTFTATVNQRVSSNAFGAVSTITVMEIAA
jgi:hypothetical protein